jgi:hypothetical protein
MHDPLKTIDNHTYERLSIERWFKIHNTCSLTGLLIDDTRLVSDTVLQNKIEKYIRVKKI